MVEDGHVVEVIEGIHIGHLDDLDVLDHLWLMLERIGIVGLGAIGGSLALAWRGAAQTLAWSRNARDRDAARAVGIAVCGADGSGWMHGMAASTVVMLAVPLAEVADVVRALLPHLPDECLLLHASSLQSRDTLGLSEIEFRRVLGTHPIAGSERSGFGAADPGMFRGATVRGEARAPDAVRDRIESLWRGAGATRVIWEKAEAHDALMSWISHLSQLTATALAAALADEGINPHDLGRGARDTTRLAASDLAMWEAILDRAPRETVAAVRRLTSALQDLGDALEARDGAALAGTWQRARSWRMAAEDPA